MSARPTAGPAQGRQAAAAAMVTGFFRRDAKPGLDERQTLPGQ